MDQQLGPVPFYLLYVRLIIVLPGIRRDRSGTINLEASSQFDAREYVGRE